LRIFAQPEPETRAATEVIISSNISVNPPTPFSGSIGTRDASTRQAQTGTLSIAFSPRSLMSLE
jgi:hypothetical protein